MGKYIREADNFMKNNKFWKLGFLGMIFINIASLPQIIKTIITSLLQESPHPLGVGVCQT